MVVIDKVTDKVQQVNILYDVSGDSLSGVAA